MSTTQARYSRLPLPAILGGGPLAILGGGPRAILDGGPRATLGGGLDAITRGGPSFVLGGNPILGIHFGKTGLRRVGSLLSVEMRALERRTSLVRSISC